MREDKPLTEGADGRGAVGVEGGLGEEKHEGPREADVGTGDGDGLRVEGEEGILKEW